ncbi:uncharacterized protein LOC129722671 isoform X1 [Wyeomyia smithii]|uniref:uncharacterized protein LOC129722671 isoform X1 n=1 Tax=Wyeomyia smithii TaxID=174621 RepID=UPI00246805AD|nr:uncharacterized protein LOC129722671 isoform X1 [Wyeomyia smithii]
MPTTVLVKMLHASYMYTPSLNFDQSARGFYVTKFVLKIEVRSFLLSCKLKFVYFCEVECISFKMRFCSVKSCDIPSYKIRKEKLTVSIHSFPRHEPIRKKWAQFCGLPLSTDAKFVCSQHFKPEDFECRYLVGQRPCLVENAVPTIRTLAEGDPSDRSLRGKRKAQAELIAELLYSESSRSHETLTSHSPVLDNRSDKKTNKLVVDIVEDAVVPMDKIVHCAQRVSQVLDIASQQRTVLQETEDAINCVQWIQNNSFVEETNEVLKLDCQFYGKCGLDVLADAIELSERSVIPSTIIENNANPLGEKKPIYETPQTIKQLKSTIFDLRNTIRNLQLKLSERDSEIQKLQCSNMDTDSQVSDLTSRIETLRNSIEDGRCVQLRKVT